MTTELAGTVNYARFRVVCFVQTNKAGVGFLFGHAEKDCKAVIKCGQLAVVTFSILKNSMSGTGNNNTAMAGVPPANTMGMSALTRELARIDAAGNLAARPKANKKAKPTRKRKSVQSQRNNRTKNQKIIAKIKQQTRKHAANRAKKLAKERKRAIKEARNAAVQARRVARAADPEFMTDSIGIHGLEELSDALDDYEVIIDTYNEVNRSNLTAYLTVLTTTLVEVFSASLRAEYEAEYPELFDEGLAIDEPFEYLSELNDFISDRVEEYDEADEEDNKATKINIDTYSQIILDAVNNIGQRVKDEDPDMLALLGQFGAAHI